MAIIDKIQLSGTVYTIGNETTTAVTSASTDNEIPTAKAVYDAIPQGGGGKAIEAGTNISITTGDTADTINCTLPIKTNNWRSLVFNSSQNPSEVVYASAFGDYTTASGEASFSIGKNTTASGNYSFVGGEANSKAKGEASFAFGYEVIANSSYSAAFGRYITTKNLYEFGCGILNNSVSDTTGGYSGNTLFSVGNGKNGARHNAFEIRQNGDIYISKDGQDVKLQDQLGGGGSITIDQSLDSGSTNAVANSAITNAINSKMDEVNFASFYGDKYSAGLKGYYYDSQTETQTEKFNWGMVWQSDGSIGFDSLGNLAVFNKIDTSAITTSVTSSSTDAQVPSAKAVYDQFGGLKLVKLTQSEYDALSPNYDENTLYVING